MKDFLVVSFEYLPFLFNLKSFGVENKSLPDSYQDSMYIVSGNTPRPLPVDGGNNDSSFKKYSFGLVLTYQIFYIHVEIKILFHFHKEKSNIHMCSV